MKTLKNIILGITLLLSTIVVAQQGINYQGVAKDSGGELIINTNIDVAINIGTLPGGGGNVYSESHNISTNANGVFSLVLGEGTPTLNLFEDIDWAVGNHYLNVWLNGEEIGTTQLQAVPYTKALGKWQAHKNGVTVKGTGASIFVGDNAGENDDFSFNNNIGIGNNVLQSNTSGFDNIALGKTALTDNTTGFGNVAIGDQSLTSNRIGHANIGIGYDSPLRVNTTGANNIALGSGVLRANQTGSSNIAIGFRTAYSNVSGFQNVAIGKDALFSNTIGHNNIGVGEEALHFNENGSNNVALGQNSNKNNISGSSNVSLGLNALPANVSGSGNIAIGANAGSNSVSGNYNVFIGRWAAADNQDDNERLYIENGTNDTPLIYGEFDNRIISFDGNVGVGTESPTVPLNIVEGNNVNLGFGTGSIVIGEETGQNLAFDDNEIQARLNGIASDLFLQDDGGNVRVGGAIVHASDKRLKRDITNISYGLQDILKMRPTEYFWKGKEQENKSLGLIAQEVDEIIKNVVTYDKEQDKYGVSYTELIPVLIKAIQEQQLIITQQSVENKTINQKIDVLQQRLLTLEESLNSNNSN